MGWSVQKSVSWFVGLSVVLLVPGLALAQLAAGEPYPLHLTGIGSFSVSVGPNLADPAGFGVAWVNEDGTVSVQGRNASAPSTPTCSTNLGLPPELDPSLCAYFGPFAQAVCKRRLQYATSVALATSGWLLVGYDVTSVADSVWSTPAARAPFGAGVHPAPVQPWYLENLDMNLHRLVVFGKKRTPSKTGATHCEDWDKNWTRFPALPPTAGARVNPEPISTAPAAVTIPAGRPGAGRTYMFVLNYVTGEASSIYYSYSDTTGRVWSPWGLLVNGYDSGGAMAYFLGRPSVAYWNGEIVLTQNEQMRNTSFIYHGAIDPTTGALRFGPGTWRSVRSGTMFNSALQIIGSSASNLYLVYYDVGTRRFWASAKNSDPTWHDAGWGAWFDVGNYPVGGFGELVYDLPPGMVDMDMPSIGFMSHYGSGRLLIAANRLGNRGGSNSFAVSVQRPSEDSWDPVFGPWELHSTYTNLALGAVASQSSTPSWGGGAGAAIDGNTSGVWSTGSVTHTEIQVSPWWQVDLGWSRHVEHIEIFNRTDCCGTRLRDFDILGSGDGVTWGAPIHVSGVAESPTQVRVGKAWRYVRIQLTSTDALSLAEVRVWGL